MSTMPRRKLVGVMGGMGPLATADFLTKLVEETPASRDQDHVPVIVHSVPQIPDRSAAMLAGDDAPLLPLLAGIRFLCLAGVDLIAMPCNSAHAWHDRLQRASRAPILHIADTAADAAAARLPRGARIAVLATAGMAATGMHAARLAARGFLSAPLTPELQELADAAIAAAKGGEIDGGRRLAGRLLARLEGLADACLLACTELPLVMPAGRLPLVDATRALAAACARASLGCVRDAAHAGSPALAG